MAERTFKAAAVAKACDLYFFETNQLIEKRREELITQAMAYDSWLWGPKTRTREEAIMYLKKKSVGGFTTAWSEPDLYNKWDEEKIERLRGLAKAKWAAGEDMILTSSEYQMIRSYMEKVD